MLLFSSSVTSQNENIEIDLSKSISTLSHDDFEYKVNYIEDKKTVYFALLKSGKVIKAYKLIVTDIHPKGVFLYENDDDTFSIRILSLNNGYVFIKENLEKKYRSSNTTNYVDIGNWSMNYKSDILNFISEFNKFIDETAPKKMNSPEDDEIIIITNKKNKN